MSLPYEDHGYDPQSLLSPERIPEEIRDAILRYGSGEKVYVGDFLAAVFRNDLVAAASRADLRNQRCLAAIAVFVRDQLPLQAWGSEKALKAWQVKHNPRTNA